ncbi:MAG: tRNA lysidine(34) synthetase TilS [Eubacteriaceae bacterium]|nr:tRNA lysidine(34) synthetase TilS [Eubacteriaceae bacterium]
MQGKTALENTDRFITRFLDSSKGLILPGERVLIALSGGSDSVFLLVMLSAVRDRLGLRLSAFHLNHMLRGEEADADEALCSELCAGFGVPLDIYREDIAALAVKEKISLEEAGRIRRYEIIESYRGRADKAATAHHADDNAETVLMHLIRGTGVQGLTGIPRIRGGYIVRPLLDFSKEEITDFLEANRIPYAVDRTNFEDDAFRSRIRNVMMPLILRENPSFARSMLRLGELAREYQDLAESEADRIAIERADGGCSVSYDDVKSLNRAVLGCLIRRMCALCGFGADIGYDSMKELFAKIKDGDDTVWDINLHKVAFYRRYGTLSARAAGDGPASTGFSFKAYAPSFIVRPAQGFALRLSFAKKMKKNDGSAHISYVDYDKIQNNLVIRSRREGDSFTQIGMERKKSVRRLMIDRKVPRERRDLIPILTDGPGIAAVIGYETAEEFKVTQETEKILKIEIINIGSGKNEK